ncbi:MAG: hypothetical protein HS128_09625 [Ideonella sp.]|nr:hypothetical protein [Ideonella sp.]MCC7459367.1 hypothetical protein [Nitrospira sp.]
MSNRRLLLIGPVLPPKGGVSVHIERLAALLEGHFRVSLLDESRNVKEFPPNLRGMSPWTYMRTVAAADVVHVHSYPAILKLLHVLVARLLFKRVVLTIHSLRSTNALSRAAVSASARLAHVCVAVSDQVARAVPGPTHVVPAFIPPAPSEMAVSAEVARWIAGQKAKGRLVFASNAYRLERFEGQDLYGLDMIIQAFAHPDVASRCACLFVVGAPDFDPNLLAHYQEEVRRRRMEEVFWLRAEPESFSGIAALADGTIRATSTDGDALSVRESLFLGKLTIASDAAARPEGTVLFKSRDVGDLVAKIAGAAGRTTHPTLDRSRLSIYADLYLNLYRHVLR